MPKQERAIVGLYNRGVGGVPIPTRGPLPGPPVQGLLPGLSDQLRILVIVLYINYVHNLFYGPSVVYCKAVTENDGDTAMWSLINTHLVSR